MTVRKAAKVLVPSLIARHPAASWAEICAFDELLNRHNVSTMLSTRSGNTSTGRRSVGRSVECDQYRILAEIPWAILGIMDQPRLKTLQDMACNLC
eukprot:scaffold22989_cov45-Prasinocladus_malaysianus.AAC.1